MILVRGNFWHTAINTALLLLSISFLMFGISQQLTSMTPFDPLLAEQRFNASQWTNPLSKNPISDQELYVYNGYRLIHGYNPILISPEVPPLGKYIIGLSIMMTGHYATFSIVAFIIVSYLVYAITRTIGKSETAGLITLFLCSIHPIFIDQIREIPQLDLYQVLFFLLSIYAYMQFHASKKIRWLGILGLTIGGFISIKAAFLYGMLTLGWLGLYYFTAVVSRKKTFISTLTESATIFSIACVVLILSYSAYFFHGGTFMGFLGVQKWIMTFYSHSGIELLPLMGNYLLLIFTGHWWFWTRGYPLVQYEHWSRMWTVLFILGWIATFKQYKPIHNTSILLLLSFIIIYSLFLFVIPMYPRYLVLLFIPFHIMIGLYFDRILIHGKAT